MSSSRIPHRLISIFLLLSLCAVLLGACRGEPLPAPIPPGDGIPEFYELMDELFSQWVSSDSLSVNFVLADPQAFGVVPPQPPTFGTVTSVQSVEQGIARNDELWEQLKEFSIEYMSLEQQIVHSILLRNIEIARLTRDNEDALFFQGVVRPLVGMQAQLPVLLAEFRFRTLEDIEIYLGLLEDIGRYFDDIIEFERERAARGFFLSAANVDSVTAHIESLLYDRENHFLIEIFNDKIDAFEGLSSSQRETFKERNEILISYNLFSAYETLLEAMRDLRGVGAHYGGLYSLPGGREFAQARLRLRTGSDRTPEEIDGLLEQWMQTTRSNAMRLYRRNPRLAEMAQNGTIGIIPGDTPENILKRLRQAIEADFPPIGETGFVVNEVHERLQEHLSPAFFLIPAIDSFHENVIFVNPASIGDNLSLFTILAHEGYPGHMYQTVYFLQQSPHPIRKMLENLGYDEGWATYVEMHSYFMAGLPENEAAVLRYEQIYNLMFISRIDLGVNALGWSLEDVVAFCTANGITSWEAIESLYELVTGNPLLYLPYSLGFIEMTMLRQEAETTLRNDFDLLEFHRFILSFGSAPFPLIRSHMPVWMAEQQQVARLVG